MVKVTVKGGDPILRHFVEMYIKNPKNDKNKLGEKATLFREALQTLPLAKTYIDKRNYKGLNEYLGGILEDNRDDNKRVEIALQTAKATDKALEEHLKSRKFLSKNQPRYTEWCERKGYLYGIFVIASKQCQILRETVVEPGKKKLHAIRILSEHIDDWLEDHPRRVKKLKDEHKWEMLKKDHIIAEKEAELQRLRATNRS